MLQKYSFIDDAIAFLPLIVCPSTVRLGTTVVFDFLLITWLLISFLEVTLKLRDFFREILAFKLCIQVI